MGRHWKLLTSILLFLLLASASARACICDTWYYAILVELEQAAWVGSGKVISSTPIPESPDLYVNTIEVYEIWKGEFTHQVQILTAYAPGACGRGPLSVGSVLLIFAQDNLFTDSDIPYYDDACDPVMPYDDALGIAESYRQEMGPPLIVDVQESSWGSLKAGY